MINIFFHKIHKNKSSCTQNSKSTSDNLLLVAQSIWLVRMALRRRIVREDSLKNMNLAAIAKFAQLHYIEPLVASALPSPKKLSIFLGEIDYLAYKTLWTAFYKNKRRSMLLSLEFARISAALSKYKIWHSAVKGMALKELYPREDTRTMSDIDVFYDVRRRDLLPEIFKELGYKAIKIRAKRHDVYEINNLCQVEMHHVFFNCWSDATHYNTDEVLHFDSGYLCCKQDTDNITSLSKEGHYLFLMNHIYNDYNSFGTGLRSMIDCAMCLRNWGLSFDWDWIAQQAISAEYGPFLTRYQNMVTKLFPADDEAPNRGVQGVLEDIKSLTEEEREIFWRCINSGQKGNDQTYANNLISTIEGKGLRKLGLKCVHIKKRIFPEFKTLKNEYPVASNIPALRRVLWIHRFLLSMYRYPSKNLTELKTLIKK